MEHRPSAPASSTSGDNSRRLRSLRRRRRERDDVQVNGVTCTQLLGSGHAGRSGGKSHTTVSLHAVLSASVTTLEDTNGRGGYTHHDDHACTHEHGRTRAARSGCVPPCVQGVVPSTPRKSYMRGPQRSSQGRSIVTVGGPCRARCATRVYTRTPYWREPWGTVSTSSPSRMDRCGLPQGALRALGVRCRTDRHANTSQVVRATLDGPPSALREVPVTFSFPKSLDFGQTLCVVGADPQIGRYIHHVSA